MLDYPEYMKNYHKENLASLSIHLSKKRDKDIIDALEKAESKSQTAKDLIRLGIEASKNK